MSRTGWIIFSVVVIVLLAGLVVWTRLSNPAIDLNGVNVNVVIPASGQNGNVGDHVIGKADSDVILVEYGDFQCPGCGSAEPNVQTLRDEYGDRVAFVFRNFPLTSIHPNARSAAGVAEAAGLQGKYWEMHDLLYSKQNEWQSLDSNQRGPKFETYATSLGLAIDRFKTDVTSSAATDKIAFDQAVGRQAGVNATPTFFLNGNKLDDATSTGILQGDLTKIKQQLDDALKD